MKTNLILSIKLLLSLFLYTQNRPIPKNLKDVQSSVLIGVTLQSGMEDAKSIVEKKSKLGNLVKNEFNLIQTTCYPAWETWKGYKKYDFTGFNNVVNWSLQQNLPVAAHLLAGPNLYFPDWFKKANYLDTELDSLLYDFIESILNSNNNGKKIAYLNVVNECLQKDGTYSYINNKQNLRSKLEQLGSEPDKSGLRGADVINTSHPIYIRKAFEYANQFTNGKLELRDFGIEFWGEEKSKGFYQLVKHLINSGVPIDAIGFQGHFKADKFYDWDLMTKSILEYKKLGLEVYLTEIDMSTEDETLSKQTVYKLQKQQYKKMTQAALAGGIDWMCFWGIRDNWNAHWLYNKHPLLFGEHLNKKPAYYGIKEALKSYSDDKSKQSEFTSKTTVSIHKDEFWINGKPTYQGRYWNGHKVEGLLINARLVNGIFDDLNPESVNTYAYPDTKIWDADRNTNEFIEAMPLWNKHGLNAFTLNIQGGSPNGYKGSPCINPGYFKDGSLRPSYMRRLDKILKKADELNMVVILGLFYFRQDEHLQDEESVKNATNNVIDWLFNKGYKNVLIEICNETSFGGLYNHDILKPNRIHELINLVKNNSQNGYTYPVSTSFAGCTIPTPNVISNADYLILHGNGANTPERLIKLAYDTRNAVTYRKKPIINNEDDHFEFDKETNNFTTSIKTYVSWGFLDFRFPGETDYSEGFQSVPVDWKINSKRKQEFFALVKNITQKR